MPAGGRIHPLRIRNDILITMPFVGDTLNVSTPPCLEEVVAVGAPSSAEGVFGAGSSVVFFTGNAAASAGPIVLHSVALLVLAVAWCFLVYIYKDYIFAALGIVRGATTTEKVLDRHEKLLGAYLNWALVLGFTALGLGFRHWAVVAVGVAVWGVQWVILAAAGGLTLYGGFTRKLFRLRRIILACGVAVLLPVFLLFTLSENEVLRWALMAGIGSMVALLAARSFVLFRRTGFSFLLWILYLCVVEIVPILTVIIAAERMY